MGLTNMWSCVWLQSGYEIFFSPTRSSLEPLLYWTLHPLPVPGNHWCDVCVPRLALSRSCDGITECGVFCAWLLSHAHAHTVHVSLVCCFLLLSSAPHSSTLAWKIPWMEEPGGLQSMGSLRTRLSNFTWTFHFHALEKEMATHSSILAWRIPGMGEPGGLPSMGSSRGWTRLKQLRSSSSSISLCEELPWTCLFLINLFLETYPVIILEARPIPPPHLWEVCLSPPASGGTRVSHGL